jgi:hypothetical protein
MKSFPGRKLILCFVILILTGLVSFLAWKKIKPSEVTGSEAGPLAQFWQKQAEKLPIFENLRTGSKRNANMQNEACAMKERMVAEFPALRVEKHPVADDQNAFLMLCQLEDFIKNLDPPLSEEFRQLLKGTTPWDANAARRFLAEQAGLVEWIEKIAALKTRSSEDLPASYKGNIGAQSGKLASDILLLKARLAAEAGDEQGTLRAISAVTNFGAHYQKIESPFLLSSTLHTLIDLNMKETALKTLLPALGKDADLSLWKSIFASTSYTSSDLANVMRGEWNTVSEHSAFPLLITDERDRKLTDAEAVARTYSSFFNAWVTTLPTLSLAQIESFRPHFEISQLSSEGQKYVEKILFGNELWTKGYIRAAIISCQQQAALDLLMLEQGGVTLGAADAARITHDSMTGLPFVFDPAKRELVAPIDSAKLSVNPLVLPW